MAQDLAMIVGTVTDSSGAFVPGVAITVSNSEKGFTRRYVTDSAGAYVAGQLPLGSFTVTAAAAGFNQVVHTGVSLDTGQTQRVDIQLTIGDLKQQVQVAANLPKVETENGAISHVITGSQISELNIPARNFANLALLIPVAAPGAAPSAGGFDPNTVGDIATDTLPINGLPGNMNNWEIDGTNDVDQGSGSDSLQVFPSLDSIAEFRISTSNYSAEYAKSGSGVIEVVTKSGTNKFHGTAFEFLPNDDMDANNWFLNRTVGGTAPKLPLKKNDFGFTFGGPVFIPGRYNIGKQKTFFFVSEEWRKNRQGIVINTPVPTNRMRQGDFSECDPSSPNYNSVVASGCQLPTDPATGTNFPGDIVPQDPVANTLLNALVPKANNGVLYYTAAPSLPTNFREDMIRVDHNISEKIRLFVRYTQDADRQDVVPSLWVSASFPTVKTTLQAPAKSAVVHLTESLRPDLMNEFIASFSTDVNNLHNSAGFDSPAGSVNRPANFGLTTLFPGNASQPILPGIIVNGGNPFSFSQDTGFNFFFWDPNVALKDNLIWAHGKHVLKTGFFLVYNAVDNSTNLGSGDTQGLLTFSTSSAVSTGNALADMYLGRIAGYEEYGTVQNGQLVGGQAHGHWREWDFEPYIQEDWHVLPNLTLNLGVRYYYFTPWADQTNPTLNSIFIPGQYNPANEAQLDAGGNLIAGTGATYLNYGNGLDQCGTNGLNKGCIQPYHGTVSPRFGFAWNPDGTGKTAIRGGYALTYDSSNSHHMAAGRYGNPPTVAELFSSNIVGYGSIQPGALPPAEMRNVPLSEKYPQIDQFSLGIQRQLFKDSVLSVGYVGTLGRHLQRIRNINQVPVGAGIENVPALAGTPGCDSLGNCNVQQILINNLEPTSFFVPYRGYSSIVQRESTGNSNYNSLQTSFRHNAGHGLFLEANYTWSHTLDNLFGGGGTNYFSNGVNDYDERRWYGTSSLNQAQVFVMNYVYSLPFFAHAGKMLHGVLGGWQLNGVTTFSTGVPIDLTCGISGLSSGVGGNVLCNPLGKLQIKKGATNDPTFGPTPTWFDPSVLGQITIPQLAANNESGMFGYLGKNPLTGPGRSNWDVGLTKNFDLHGRGEDRTTLQFRAETFNTFNHPQWSTVNLSCNGLTAPGASCNGPNNIGNGEVTGAWDPRIIQLGLRLVF
jgi:hypothetical protein